MKKTAVVFLILAGLVATFIDASAKDRDGHHGKNANRDNDSTEYGRFTVRERKEIHSYFAYRVNATYAGNKPSITISYVSVKNRTEQDPGQSESIPVLVIRAHLTPAQVADVRAKLEVAKNNQPVGVVEAGGHDDLIRFNLMDSAHRMVISEWRNEHTGFAERVESFDSTGKTLGVTLYKRLTFNPRKFPSVPDKPVVLDFEQMAGDKRLDLENLDGLLDGLIRIGRLRDFERD